MDEINLTLLYIWVDCRFWGMVGIYAMSKYMILWKTGLLNQSGQLISVSTILVLLKSMQLSHCSGIDPKQHCWVVTSVAVSWLPHR